jgi:hypothetical protein
VDKEPLITVGTITAIASAVVAALVAFGLNLTEAQTTAILGIVAVAAPIAVTWIGRGKVASPATLRAVKAQTQAPPNPDQY